MNQASAALAELAALDRAALARRPRRLRSEPLMTPRTEWGCQPVSEVICSWSTRNAHPRFVAGLERIGATLREFGLD